MKVQIYQLPIIFGDSSKNEAQITQWFEKNMNAEIDVVVLPEMWNNGYDLEHLNESADILTVDLNLNEVEQQRENIPVFKSIKLDLYK